MCWKAASLIGHFAGVFAAKLRTVQSWQRWETTLLRSWPSRRDEHVITGSAFSVVGLVQYVWQQRFIGARVTFGPIGMWPITTLEQRTEVSFTLGKPSTCILRTSSSKLMVHLSGSYNSIVLFYTDLELCSAWSLAYLVRILLAARCAWSRWILMRCFSSAALDTHFTLSWRCGLTTSSDFGSGQASQAKAAAWKKKIGLSYTAGRTSTF